MADPTTLRRSPLAHVPAGTGTDRVRLAELPFRAMVSLRLDPRSGAADWCHSTSS